MRLTLIFFIFSQLIIAQNISGLILDSETNEPIENVTVYFEKYNTGSVSDANGVFNIKVNSRPTENDYLEFSLMGYHSKAIALTMLLPTNNKIYLSKKLENLNEVVINSSKKLKSRIHFKRLKPLKTGVFAFDSQVVGNNIYVISGNSSQIEDSGKRALLAVSNLPRGSFADLIKEMNQNFSFENYTDKLQIYNIEDNSWSVSETKFRNRAYHNLNCYGNELYSLGGKRLSINRKKEYLDDKIEVFDMGSRQITIDHTNPHQAINFASFTYNDNIIVMGGSFSKNKKGKKMFTDASHIYNISSGHWYELPKMTIKKETQGVIIDDVIYLIGGSNGKKLNTIESFAIKTGVWNTEGSLFNAMEYPALAVHKHMIYIFNNRRLLNYNTKTKVLESYKIDLDLNRPKMHYHQNKLYIIGGYLLNEYSKKASSSLYVIDLVEFDKTKLFNSKDVN
ncbi:carboxypeptidase-like regulatory domain-containing protein [uncultured Psychroserpens sp.]|uniref:Kelch repeat-containing protein n=1 Tax=uncultured Psychroserpens sp. TaxID=255436 RepID=UPI002612C5F8|nr:carboxypeptidase-like regulatory domain-containing protein [uncultured Psychroserpens sp.]